MGADRNTGNKARAIGRNQSILSVPMEGTDADGRTIVISRDESPYKVDEVSDTLFYLGFAEAGSADNEPVWKIRRIQQVGSIWELKYAFGREEYIYKWSDRATLTYL